MIKVKPHSCAEQLIILDLLTCIFNYPGLSIMKFLTVENKRFERGVKEAIYIWVAKLSLNKDGTHCLLSAGPGTPTPYSPVD